MLWRLWVIVIMKIHSKSIATALTQALAELYIIFGDWAFILYFNFWRSAKIVRLEFLLMVIIW